MWRLHAVLESARTGCESSRRQTTIFDATYVNKQWEHGELCGVAESKASGTNNSLVTLTLSASDAIMTNASDAMSKMLQKIAREKLNRSQQRGHASNAHMTILLSVPSAKCATLHARKR